MMQKSSFKQFRNRLKDDCSGMALVEFALIAPFMMAFVAGGTELANYAIKTTQVSQIAIQLADNASRIGEGDPISAKRVTQTQINDVLTGAGLHSGNLDIYGTHKEGTATVGNGRVVISSFEVIADSNPVRYKVAWQQCRGTASLYSPQYGTPSTAYNNTLISSGMGPAGRKVTPTATTPVIFVEVSYRYQPLFTAFAQMQYSNFNSTAAMMVRDTRDMSQVYNTEGAPTANCTTT